MREEILQGDVLKIERIKVHSIFFVSTDDISGYVLCEQVKLLDLKVRGYKKIGCILLGDKINITDAIQGIFEYV